MRDSKEIYQIISETFNQICSGNLQEQEDGGWGRSTPAEREERARFYLGDPELTGQLKQPGKDIKRTTQYKETEKKEKERERRWLAAGDIDPLAQLSTPYLDDPDLVKKHGKEWLTQRAYDLYGVLPAGAQSAKMPGFMVDKDKPEEYAFHSPEATTQRWETAKRQMGNIVDPALSGLALYPPFRVPALATSAGLNIAQGDPGGAATSLAFMTPVGPLARGLGAAAGKSTQLGSKGLEALRIGTARGADKLVQPGRIGRGRVRDALFGTPATRGTATYPPTTTTPATSGTPGALRAAGAAMFPHATEPMRTATGKGTEAVVGTLLGSKSGALSPTRRLPGWIRGGATTPGGHRAHEAIRNRLAALERATAEMTRQQARQSRGWLAKRLSPTDTFRKAGAFGLENLGGALPIARTAGLLHRGEDPDVTARQGAQDMINFLVRGKGPLATAWRGARGAFDWGAEQGTKAVKGVPKEFPGLVPGVSDDVKPMLQAIKDRLTGTEDMSPEEIKALETTSGPKR